MPMGSSTQRSFRWRREWLGSSTGPSWYIRRHGPLQFFFKKHEGFRDTVYLDSLGKATIGYGHLLTEDDDFEEGIQYDKSLLENLFDKDFNRSAYNAEQLLEGIDICDAAREIIVEMVFQLGIGGVSKFKKMFEALRKKDYNEAAEQMLDSQWRVQTPKRCEELSDLMRSCA